PPLSTIMEPTSSTLTISEPQDSKHASTANVDTAVITLATIRWQQFRDVFSFDFLQVLFFLLLLLVLAYIVHLLFLRALRAHVHGKNQPNSQTPDHAWAQYQRLVRGEI